MEQRLGRAYNRSRFSKGLQPLRCFSDQSGGQAYFFSLFLDESSAFFGLSDFDEPSDLEVLSDFEESSDFDLFSFFEEESPLEEFEEEEGAEDFLA